MTLNIHNTTPSSKTSKWLKWMLYGTFLLMYSIFTLVAFAVIAYADQIAVGMFFAILPFLFLLWFHWDQKINEASIECNKHIRFQIRT